jgi:hypothetical protein
MDTAPRAFVIPAVVALLAAACGRSGLGVKTGGLEGGSVESSGAAGGSWEEGSAHYGGGHGSSISGEVSSGGASGTGDVGSSWSPPVNHRPSDIECTLPALAGTCPCNGNSSCPSSFSLRCSIDSECADAGANGRCISDGQMGCYCTTDSCDGDVDCPADQTCACHGSPYTYGAGNVCVPGNCRVDADCGSGGYCSPSPAVLCGTTSHCQGVAYYCHTPQDQCDNDTDCAGNGLGFIGCFYSTSEGFWLCSAYVQ